MTIQELHNMQLHERQSVNNYLSILRVLGGWIYFTVNERGHELTAVFVPHPK